MIHVNNPASISATPGCCAEEFLQNIEPRMPSRLSPDDQQRVDDYLSAPQHQVERQPFRPWRLALIVLTVVACLGLLSRILGRLAL
ncbi:Protein of unknown function [Azotobacter beijerinckii]|uniref:DUF3094 domain-containing protein n=1 Tax=Azotobacter beijerinckii TaxID=170623 RepID=A0A1H6RC21_9GAMM|nr:Protein of unknown function [Azotobacter beijerinckii]